MSRAAAPLVTVLVVNYNGSAHVNECFSSLFSQTYREFEVIMVDNGSRDGSAERVEAAFPEVRVLRAGRNLGFAGGNNFGLPHCRGEYVYLLNNDTRMDPRALEEIVRAAAEHPSAGVLASLLLNYYHPDRVDSAGDVLYTTGGVFSFRDYPADRFTAVRPVMSACAGAALYSRALLESLGGFDEDFFLIFEDVDLSLRARHAGREVLSVPASRVYHKSSASLGGKRSALSIYYCERNLPLLLIKDFPAGSLLRLAPGFLALKLLNGLRAAREGNLGPYLRGTRDGLLRLPSMLVKRRAILGASTLAPGEFSRLLRRNWLRERLKFKKQDFDIPL